MILKVTIKYTVNLMVAYHELMILKVTIQLDELVQIVPYGVHVY